MRTLIALLLLPLHLFAQNPGPSVTGALSPPPCVPPTMTYRWTPTAGCSTSTPCATDQVSGNNASQTTSGNLPTYNATGGPNSTPSLTFNGTSAYILPTTAIAATTDLTIYFIFKTASTPSVAYPITGGASNSINSGVASFNQAFLNQDDVVGTSGTRTFTAGTWYTEVITYHNATTTAAFYAAAGGSLLSDGGGSSQALAFSAATPDLGGSANDNQWFNGAIAEIGYSTSVNTVGIANWSSCHYGV